MKNTLSVLQFMGLLHAYSCARGAVIWGERNRHTRQAVIETASDAINEFCAQNAITLSGEEFSELREALLRVALVTDLGIIE